MKIFTTIIILPLALMVLWSGGIEPFFIKIEEISIPLKTDGDELEDVTFVQISDIHFRSFAFREKRLLENLKKIGPDYIFITGDLIDWSTEDTNGLRNFLKELASIANQKTFLVYGNHEHRNFRIKEMDKIFQENGLHLLKNKNILLRQGIYLIGVDDPHLGLDDLGLSLANIPEGAPKILLAHSPEIFEKIESDNILVLAGHTHGGQINIPFLAEKILPLKDGSIHYKRGLLLAIKGGFM